MPPENVDARGTNEPSEQAAPKVKRVEWVERWRDVIAADPYLPGVWRRQAGGFHMRRRTTDPRTGQLREVNRALPNVRKARDAFAWLQGELERIQSGVTAAQPSATPKIAAYAKLVLQRKLDLGEIRSAAGRSKWKTSSTTT